MKFDISNIQFSKMDFEKGLTLPKEHSTELAEFIGILIGDGYLHNNKKKYVIGIVGHPKNDYEYFLKIKKLILNLFNIETKIKIGGRGLRLVFNSKGIFQFITNVIGLEYGRGKGQRVKIPVSIMEEDSLSDSVLRGIFDTDGTIFTSYKKGSPDYPCIELTTTSINLAIQVKELLWDKGFRVAGVRAYKYRNSDNISNKVSLYGYNNIFKWYNQVGFSNPIKNKKLINIIKNGNGVI